MQMVHHFRELAASGRKAKRSDDWVLANPEQQKPAYTCFRYMSGTWIPDEAAECPSYIVSRYDKTVMTQVAGKLFTKVRLSDSAIVWQEP